MDWHKRYRQQANWTRELRAYIWGKIGLDESSRALEVGCGTGAILAETHFPVFGLDIALASLKEAKNHTQSRIPLTCGDAFSLPYADASFEAVFCHFLLLWLPNPHAALKEMMRITKAEGHIIAFAEPDYSRRVDQPNTLAELGKWQNAALKARGANISLGWELAELFYGAGIQIVETGTIIKSTRGTLNAEERALEWATIEADLTGRVSDERIKKMKRLDQEAWKKGGRILHIPTHYIWGQIMQYNAP